MSESPSSRNRLAEESSPYLQQHADNPVHWQPWDEVALAEAKRRDLPIFLSIGYSSCHWCHVMERESFADKDIARLLNAAFVCVKVDREERPDLDHMYMRAAMAMTGGGGWPLTMVLTPERKPIFAATYLPPRSHQGGAGLEDVIRQVSSAWRGDRAKAESLGREVMRFLAAQPDTMGSIEASVVEQAYVALAEEFEDHYGGFGGPPKFPTPHKLMFLLRHWHATGEEQALGMVEKTMRHMAQGGIHDQLGGGFHRYSTDIKWLVPHFEKMLYDQAMLAMAYTELYQASKTPWAKKVAIDILDYTLTNMRSPEGMFYSAEDADSAGREGAFYTWTYGEMASVVPQEDLDIFCQAYGVRKEGNFRDRESKAREAVNILFRAQGTAEIARERERPAHEVEASLERSKTALLIARGARERPFRDEKCLLDWNGLMIAALAKAGVALHERRFVEEAARTQAAMEEHLRTGEGMLHVYSEGRARIPAFLNDHAYYAWGLLELHQATLDAAYLRRCVEELKEIEAFKDGSGGLSLSKEGDVRSREVYDGVTPSGNSAAAYVAALVSVLEEDIELRPRQIMEASWKQVAANPEAHIFMLMAADLLLRPPAHLAVGERAGEFLSSIRPDFHPRLLLELDRSLGARVRLCGRNACLPSPVDPEELRAQLLREKA